MVMQRSFIVPECAHCKSKLQYIFVHPAITDPTKIHLWEGFSVLRCVRCQRLFDVQENANGMKIRELILSLKEPKRDANI